MQTFLNQLVYFGFFQSLFLLTIYLFSSKNRQNINGYIAFLIFVLFLGLSGHILYISEIFGANRKLISISEFATLFFGATVYLFTKSSLLGQRFSYGELVHYIPGIVYTLFILFYFTLAPKEVINARVRSGELFTVVSMVIGIALIVNITYWAASVYHFYEFRKRMLNELSYSVKTQFFLNFLIAIGVCLFVWVGIYFISFMGYDMIEIEARQGIWLGIAFIILFIAYYSMTEPEIFKEQPLATVQKYAQSKLSLADLDRLKANLEQLMEEKKPYLANKLLKAELAEMMGISNPELARLLNERIGMNFFEYVNYFRIKEFIRLAQSEQAQNMTFFGLAQEAGFNSKSTFNKSFKQLMGQTPREYLAGKY
ncbi:MAG: helix-turn-helix domain-containing protein [Bacteroidota bacterium]